MPRDREENVFREKVELLSKIPRRFSEECRDLDYRAGYSDGYKTGYWKAYEDFGKRVIEIEQKISSLNPIKVKP